MRLIEQDEDGIWILQEDDKGRSWYMLVDRASDLHRDGYIFFKQKWVLRPSRGGNPCLL